MVWKSPGKSGVMDRTEKTRRWIIHRRLEGWKVQDIATALRANEKTIDRWCSVYKKHGWAGLQVKSHKPHTIHRTPQATVNLILQLRRTRNWGPCRIEGYLRNYHATSISHTTIHKILNKLDSTIQSPSRERSGVNADSSGSIAIASGRLTSSSPSRMNG
jgi:transposase